MAGTTKETKTPHTTRNNLAPYYKERKRKGQDPLRTRVPYVFTDPKGRFVVKVSRNGKNRRKLCKDLTEAKYWSENLSLLFPEHEPKPEGLALTVAALVDRYPPRTNKANARRSDRILKKLLGDKMVGQLNPVAVERFLDRRKKMSVQYAITRLRKDGTKVTTYKDKQPPKQISAKTANDDVRRLHKICEDAVKEGLLKQNPCRGWKPLPEPPPRTRWLSSEEEERLKTAVKEDWFWRLIEIAMFSGMRQEEQFGCKCSQILWESNSIYLPRTKTRKARHIPMSARLRAAVEAQVELGKKWLCPNGSLSNRLGQKTLYRKFNTALREAGIEDFVWHDLRHTFCSRLAMAGVPLRTIQELAGHARIETTERYAHLSKSHLHEEVKKLD